MCRITSQITKIPNIPKDRANRADSDAGNGKVVGAGLAQSKNVVIGATGPQYAKKVTLIVPRSCCGHHHGLHERGLSTDVSLAMCRA